MDMEDEIILRVINNSPTAIVACDLDFNVTIWNKGATELFGYSKEEVMGSFQKITLPHKIGEFMETMEEVMKGNKVNMKTKLLHKNGSIIDVIINVSPISEETNSDKIVGITAIMRKQSEMESVAKKIMMEKNRSMSHVKKRTFKDLRISILNHLSSGKKTINQLAVLSGINWKTVDNHLVYLTGKRLVKEVFNSEYVRIFDITKEGQELISKSKREAEQIVTK